jgi:hypothetical protein
VTEYIGRRLPNGSSYVLVVGPKGERPLDPRRDLLKYADHFDWGYAAAPPMQLALAILADCLGDDEAARKLHHNFLWVYVSSWAHDGFAVTAAEVRAAVNRLRAESSI